MSVREEERPRGNSTNRGLGLAAAIGVGVGVGAALYYFLTKETERPNAEGATTSGWRCEEPQAFRQRSWSLEECSICCEVMLKDQPLRSLPCTHNFHVRCLEPWIREHNTCPNCRKPA